jgi:hypothetical protein
MVESGQVNAEEAGQLFDVLLDEAMAPLPAVVSHRTLRVWVTDTTTRNRKVNLTATLPLSLLRVSLQTLGSLVPPLRDGRAEQIMLSLEQGATGRVMDLQDLEEGKRVEIFIE